MDETVIDLINGCLNKDPCLRYDIKQIVNHEFFKKHCPELIASNHKLPRTSSLSSNEAIKWGFLFIKLNLIDPYITLLFLFLFNDLI